MPKRDRLKIKCAKCANRSWIKLNRRILREYLEGHKENCTDVIGVYPMLEDGTCYFLVFDFDNHDKKKDPLHRKFKDVVGITFKHSWGRVEFL